MGHETEHQPSGSPPVAHTRSTDAKVAVAHPPTPAQADRIASPASHWPLFFPDAIKLGYVDIGQHATRLVGIHVNLHDDRGPRCHVRVVGAAPELNLVVESAPGYVPTAKNAGNERDHVVLGFRPVRAGKFSAHLELEIADAPREVIRIPIVGVAGLEAEPREPEPTPPKPEDIEPLPRFVELGEQIVGSEHLFPLAIVKNKHYTRNRARVDFAIEPPAARPEIPNELRVDTGTSAFKLERQAVTLEGSWEDAPLRVWFRPMRPGRFRGDVVVTTAWENGRHVEEPIDVRAGARRLEEAPEQPPTPVPAAPDAKEPEQGKEPTNTQSEVAASHAQDASNAAVHLANEQRAGLDKAHEEILGAEKPVAPKPSVFSVLADLALTLAVGGLAQVIGKFVASNLVSVLKNMRPKQVSGLRITDGLGSSIKDGLKWALKAAIHLDSSAGAVSSPGSESADPRVDFFARQRTILNHLANENAKLISAEHRRLAPAVGEAPEAVNQVFMTLTSGFEAAIAGKSSIRAQDRQARETVVQWTKGLAQHSFGTTTAERGGKRVGAATDLSRPRAAKDARGLVEIYATMAGDHVDPARLKLERGELHGVAQAAANRLADTPLRDLQLPIRIVVRSSAGTAYITRDELGRVHVEGELPAQDPVTSVPSRTQDERRERRDAQLNRDAEALCETVLGWNVFLATDMPIPGL